MSKKALLLAGIAAFAYYQYKKMTPQQKQDLKGNIKKQGEKILDNLPDEVKNIFTPKTAEPGA